jgi:hypothetical protein
MTHYSVRSRLEAVRGESGHEAIPRSSTWRIDGAGRSMSSTTCRQSPLAFGGQAAGLNVEIGDGRAGVVHVATRRPQPVSVHRLILGRFYRRCRDTADTAL